MWSDAESESMLLALPGVFEPSSSLNSIFPL